MSTKTHNKHNIRTKISEIDERAYHTIIFSFLKWFPILILVRLHEVYIGEVIILDFSMTNLFSSSLQYLIWLIKLPSFAWYIWIRGNYWRSSIIDILNSFCIMLEKSFYKDFLVAPKRILSTWIWTTKMTCSIFFVKRVLSTCSFWNMFSRKKLLRRT